MTFSITPKTRSLVLLGVLVYILIGLAGALEPLILHSWFILTGGAIVIGYSWITYLAWASPDDFNRRMSAQIAELHKFPIYRWITITNLPFLLWVHRLFAPFVVLMGILVVLMGFGMTEFVIIPIQTVR